MMLWGLADHFVEEVVELYRSREHAERALRRVLDDEPDWAGMMEVVPVTLPLDGHWRPKGRRVRSPRCRRVTSLR
jgi:hypothetical protein